MTIDQNLDKAVGEVKDIQVEEIVEEETDFMAGGLCSADAAYFGASATLI